MQSIAATPFCGVTAQAANLRIDSWSGLWKCQRRNMLPTSEFRWNFFATSHGKGAVDGVGGVLKRRAWNKVNARQVVIQNAAESTDAVKDGGIICNFLTEYPREVTHVRGLEYCVNMMHPSGSGYRWPHGQKDEIYNYETDIVKTLAAPEPSRSRGTFGFNI